MTQVKQDDLLAVLERAGLALSWAKKEGKILYYKRTTTNGEYCDAVDNLDATIAEIQKILRDAQ